MKRAIAAILLAASSRALAGGITPQGGTVTGVAAASGGGLTGGGTGGQVYLSLITTCASNQVLAWNGTGWACAANGTGDLTGTLTSGRIPRASGAKTTVDGSWSDDGAALSTTSLVTLGGPALGTSIPLSLKINNTNNAQTMLQLTSTLEPGAANFGISQAEVAETGYLGAYNDRTMRMGYNLCGSARCDNTQQGWGFQWESKFDDGSGHGYQSELHWFSLDATTGTEHRLITTEAKWDGSEAGVQFMATNLTFTAWNSDFVGRITATSAAAANFLMQAKTAIKSDDASNILTVNVLTGNKQVFRVGPNDTEIDGALAVSTSNVTPVVINGSGAKNIEIDAGTKTLNISMQANGATTWENRYAGGTTSFYDDGNFSVQDYNNGQNPRLLVTSTDTRVFGNSRLGSSAIFGWSSGTADSAPDTAFARASAGVVEVNCGTAGTPCALTASSLSVGGNSGPKWTNGTGAPSGTCTVGSLYSNNSGGASTTLYVCTGASTWTAK